MATFSWAAAGDVAGGVAGAFSSWASANATSRVNKANADAANMVREGQNKQRAANSSLAATIRSMANNALLTAGGAATNSASESLARTQEAWTRGNFEQGLRGVEELGAWTARAAAAGVGGSSVQQVSYSMTLKQARMSERQQERQDEGTYDAIVARAGIMPAYSSRSDFSPNNVGLDYSRNQAADGAGGTGLLAMLTEGLLRKAPSLQVALDSMNPGPVTPQTTTTGDFARMDRGQGAIQIN
jgi:hypothetical protein